MPQPRVRGQGRRPEADEPIGRGEKAKKEEITVWWGGKRRAVDDGGTAYLRVWG